MEFFLSYMCRQVFNSLSVDYNINKFQIINDLLTHNEIEKVYYA